jgi:preprotein translocase subunit SecG
LMVWPACEGAADVSSARASPANMDRFTATLFFAFQLPKSNG